MDNEVYEAFEEALHKLCDLADYDYDAAVLYTEYMTEQQLINETELLKEGIESYEN